MGKSNKGVNIGVGLDTSQIATGMQQLTGQLRALVAEAKRLEPPIAAVNVQATKMGQNMTQVSQNAGLAGATVMSFNGIVQDANYGIRGIANNLQQVGVMFSGLVAKTGSLKMAFVELRTAVLGPLGILLAFTAVITWLERLEKQTQKAASAKKKLKAETDKLSQEFANQSGQAMILFGSLSKLVTENGSLSDIKAAAKEINDKYNTSLNTEKVTLQDLNKAYGDVLTSIKLNIALKSQQASLDKAIEGETKANKKLNELFRERLRISNQIAKGEINQEYGLEKIAALDKERDAFNKNLEGHQKNQNIALANALSLTSKLNDLNLDKPDPTSKSKKPRAFKLDSYPAEEQLAAELKAFEDLERMRNGEIEIAKHWYDAHNDMRQAFWDGMEIEETGEFSTEEWKKKFAELKKVVVDEAEKMGQAINAAISRFAADAFTGLFSSFGASLAGEKGAIKKFGEEFLAELGGFFVKMGGMIFAYGAAMLAFKMSLGNPVTAMVAGAALAAIGGAVIATHKKKFGAESGGGYSSSGYAGSNSYSGINSNQNIIYTRLDGRDLVISNQRTGYSMGR